MIRRNLLESGVCVFVLAGCGAPEVAITPEVNFSGPAVSVPFDVDKTVQDARFRYYTDFEGVLHTHRDVYSVAAQHGLVAITPRHWVDDADPEAAPEWLDPEASRTLEGAPLTLETVSIRRGALLPLGTGAITAAQQGYLSIDRGVAEEQIKSHPRGIEQLWVFNEAPAGDGHVTVAVAVKGQRYVGETSIGHHFVDPFSGVGISYSHATWIDAIGLRARIPVMYADGQLSIEVPDHLIRSSSFPAVLDPQVNAEFGTGAGANGSATGVQARPAIASDGTDFLIAWEDGRRGPSNEIYAARVSAAGVLQDTVGIEVTSLIDDQRDPAVAYNGTEYLIVWADRRNASDYNLYGQRVSTGGALNGAEIAISTAANDQRYPAVAANGTSWIVVYQSDQGGTNQIYGAEIDNAGTLNSGPTQINATANAQRFSDIECDGTNCLAVWTESNDVQCRRLNTSIVVQGAAVNITTGTQGADFYPDVSYDGTTNYLVTWTKYLGKYLVKARRVAAADTTLVGTEVSIADATGSQQVSAVSHDGTNYLVTWFDSRIGTADEDIYGVRVTDAAAVIEAFPLVIGNRAGKDRWPAVAAGAGQWMIAWQEFEIQSNYDENIFQNRVSSAGAVSGTTFGASVANSGAGRSAVAVAYDDVKDYYYVVHRAAGTAGGRAPAIVGNRIRFDGVNLDGSGVLIAASGAAPAVARNTDDNEFLVVWTVFDGTRWTVKGSRISSAYAVLDNPAIDISDAGAGDQTFPEVSYAGDDGPLGTAYMVVFQSSENGAGQIDIFASKVETDATDNTDIEISAFWGPGTYTRPHIATEGVFNYVVYEHHNGTDLDVRASYIDNRTPAVFLYHRDISTETGDQRFPRVKSDGTNFLVVWEDRRGGTGDIYGRIASNGGVPQGTVDGDAISADAADEMRPDITIGGVSNDRALIVWRKEVSSGNIDIVGITRDSTDLTTGVCGEFDIATITNSEEDAPVVEASDVASDFSAVFYSGFDTTNNVGNWHGNVLRLDRGVCN